MKKFTKLVLCLALVLVVGLSAVLLTACDEGPAPVVEETIPSYKVNFYRNYQEDSADSPVLSQAVNVQRGNTVKQDSVNEPARPAGYVFDKWYADIECTTPFDFSQKVTGNLKAYAGWVTNDKSADVELHTTKLVEQTETIKYFDKTDDVSKTKEVSTGVWKFKYSEDSYAVPNLSAGNSFTFENYDRAGGKFSSFINANAKYAVYLDEACRRSAGDTVSLVNGNNYFYMKVTAEDDILTAVYKIDIYLTPVYTVTVETVQNSGTSKSRTYSEGSKLSANEFPTDGANPGYTFVGWFYHYNGYKLNDKGQYIDKDNNVLKLFEDGNFYYVNAEGNRYPVYVDKDGKPTRREGDTYYKADRNGNFVLENNEKVAVPYADLYNTLGTDGLPLYEQGKAVLDQTYENVWDFDKCAVDKSFIIYGKWVANDYTITFDLNDPDGHAHYSGNTTANVTYGIEAFALGTIVKNSCAGNMPTHDYAQFMGWEYNGLLMVNAIGVGMNGWTIPSDATLTAKWKYNSYNVNVTSNNVAMGEVSGSGSLRYDEKVKTVTAVANAGYEFVNWTINGTPVSTDAKFTYTLNLNDLDDGEINIRATFRLVSIALTLDYKLESGEALADVSTSTTIPTSITATFGNQLYGTTNYLPVIKNASPNGQRLFVGWYFTYVEEEETVTVMLTDKNTPTEGNATWSAAVITTLKALQVAGETPTLHVLWNPNNYNVNIYNATYSTANMGSINVGVNLPNGTPGTLTDIVTEGEYRIDNYLLIGQKTTTVYGTKFSLTQTNNDAGLYVFKGWYIVDLTAAKPLASLTAENLIKDEDTATDGVQYTLGEGDVTIVALWYYQPVTLSLKETGGETITVQVNIDSTALIGATAAALIPANREGYDFIGWVSRNGTLYIDNQGVVVKKIVNAGLIETGLELTDKWQKKNYFVVEEGVIVGLTEDGAKKDVLEIPTDDGIFSIAQGAFKDNTNITSLTINGNITDIGAYAFANSKITTVIFKGAFKGLTVGAYAFQNCGISSIEFPDGTLGIAQYALSGCSKLTNLKYSAEVPLGTLFDTSEPETGAWYAVEQNGSTYYIPNVLELVSVSNTADTICDYAFVNCAHVLSFNLALPVATNSEKKYTKTIGKYAFAMLSEYATQNSTAPSISLAKVENIGYYAFAGSKLTSVNFEELRSLGTAAFKGSYLVSVDFNNTPLDSISASCFENCAELTSVKYGNVKYIEQYAFYNCKAYTTISASDNANKIKTIGMYAYSETGLNTAAVARMTNVDKVDQFAFKSNVDGSWDNSVTGIMTVGTVLYFYKSGEVANLANRASIKSIAMSAFKNAELTIQGADFSEYTSLQYIYNNAFEGSDLKSIILPANLVDIKENAFRNCSHLTSVIMQACTKLQTIGVAAFKDCVMLANVAFVNITGANDALVNATKLAIATRAFEGCVLMAEITLPDSLASLGEYAFSGCTALGTVNFVQNSKFEATYTEGEENKWTKQDDPVYTTTSGLITKIEKGVFMNTGLSSITIPYFINEISDYAFNGCSSLVTVTNVYAASTDESGKKTYRTNLRTLGKYAFAGAVSLTTFNPGEDEEIRKVSLSDVSLIGEGVFQYCESLAEINMKTVSVIPAKAFDGCEKLKKATVSASVSLVGEMAFQNCTSLITLTATNGISEVGAKAFRNCYLLTALKLSSTGTSKVIGNQAFQNCAALTSVTIPSSTDTIGDGAFMGCTSLNTVTFASNETLTKVGISAFAGCIQLSEITLPGSVKTVGESAFANCERLQSVNIGENINYIGADAFKGCSGITVTLVGKTVPDLGGEIFTEGNAFTICVRRGYLNTFIASNEWAIYQTHFIESAN